MHGQAVLGRHINPHKQLERHLTRDQAQGVAVQQVLHAHQHPRLGQLEADALPGAQAKRQEGVGHPGPQGFGFRGAFEEPEGGRGTHKLGNDRIVGKEKTARRGTGRTKKQKGR